MVAERTADEVDQLVRMAQQQATKRGLRGADADDAVQEAVLLALQTPNVLHSAKAVEYGVGDAALAERRHHRSPEDIAAARARRRNALRVCQAFADCPIDRAALAELPTVAQAVDDLIARAVRAAGFRVDLAAKTLGITRTRVRGALGRLPELAAARLAAMPQQRRGPTRPV